jgi:hypothetical protein
MRLNIEVATAAIILAQILGGALMLQAVMAGGGYARAGEPVLVGERGPEVFAPTTAGTVVPQYGEPNFGLARELPGQEMPAISPQPEAWDRWLADRPLSENIEDRRGDDQTDLDEIRWQKWYGPKKALKQFPPTSESRTPSWLKAQEEAWLKAKAPR